MLKIFLKILKNKKSRTYYNINVRIPQIEVNYTNFLAKFKIWSLIKLSRFKLKYFLILHDMHFSRYAWSQWTALKVCLCNTCQIITELLLLSFHQNSYTTLP